MVIRLFAYLPLLMRFDKLSSQDTRWCASAKIWLAKNEVFVLLSYEWDSLHKIVFYPLFHLIFDLYHFHLKIRNMSQVIDILLDVLDINIIGSYFIWVFQTGIDFIAFIKVSHVQSVIPYTFKVIAPLYPHLSLRNCQVLRKSMDASCMDKLLFVRLIRKCALVILPLIPHILRILDLGWLVQHPRRASQSDAPA